MSEDQRDSLMKTLSYMDNTLGCSVRNTAIYKQLIKRTQGLVNATQHTTQHKESSEEGGNHKVTIVVQVNYLQKFLQRYWVGSRWDETMCCRVFS